MMENPIKMEDLGGKTHYFRKHPYGDVSSKGKTCGKGRKSLVVNVTCITPVNPTNHHPRPQLFNRV